MTRISCVQLGPAILDVAANGRRTVAAVRSAVREGAQVVALPELVTSGYVFRSQDEVREAAIPADDPLFAAWSREAGKGDAVVVGGFCELGEDGHVYNSVAVVDASGVRAVYRKLHLWDREKLFFRPGADAPPIAETPHGRIGVLICYDLEFPEMTRSLALRGADLIVVPANWPLVDRPAGERPPEVVAAMAAARANRLFIACCDRAGTERGQRWTEGSSIVDESGWVAAAVEGIGRATAEVDLTRARNKRLTEFSDAFGDRRIDFYRGVTDISSPPAGGERTSLAGDTPAATGR
jgi:predicted amidohydrolase